MVTHNVELISVIYYIIVSDVESERKVSLLVGNQTDCGDIN